MKKIPNNRTIIIYNNKNRENNLNPIIIDKKINPILTNAIINHYQWFNYLNLDKRVAKMYRIQIIIIIITIIIIIIIINIIII
jgi:hypothetical protein